MSPLKLLFCSFAGLLLSMNLCSAQQGSVYPLQRDDTTIREKYYQQALQNYNSLIKSLDKEYKKEYKEIYESRFEGVSDLLKSSRTVSEPVAHAYLQSILKKLVDNNPELKDLEIRLIFTRDAIPNAYSMGEGTLAVNAGLIIYLDNEAQLVFVLCHELAHLYMDHSNKQIRKSIEISHSEELKKEVKSLSKQQYGAGQKYEELVKRYSFMRGRYSREDEAEADKVAIRFMKRTNFDCNQATTCLQLLDRINDTTFFKPVNPEEIFQFDEYPFKKKWIQKETSIFASLSGDNSILTKAEKDSLKTHPDCLKRAAALQDSIQAAPSGQQFLVDEQLFKKLKKDFIPEIAEQQFKHDNLSYHLYLSLQLLQKEAFADYAAYCIVRCLNDLYDHQKKHEIGLVADKETRTYDPNYNLVLRMIDRLRLEDIANLSYYFSKKYSAKLSAYPGFVEEMRKAEKLKKEN